MSYVKVIEAHLEEERDNVWTHLHSPSSRHMREPVFRLRMELVLDEAAAYAFSVWMRRQWDADVPVAPVPRLLRR